MNKHYIRTLAIVCLCLSCLNSCFDLEQYPLDKPNSGTFWQTDEQARAGIMGVYAQMRNINVFGALYGIECLSDISYGYGVPTQEAIAKGTYTDRDGDVLNRWKNTYQGIALANTAIRKIQASGTISEKVKAETTAEGHFMRALYYFHLWDFFGGVPLYDETTDIDKDFNNMLKPRSTSEETAKFILADLEKAISGLPPKWGASEFGRATKGAAIALKGKVNLYAKDYDEAAKAFREVVNNSTTYGYALNPNYADIFTPKGDTSSEIVFAAQNMGGVATPFGMPIALYMGSRSTFGSCWNNSMPATALADMYELKDGKKFNWDDFIPGLSADNAIKTETFVAKLSADNKKVAEYPKNLQLLKDVYAQRDPRMEQSLIVPYSKYLGWVAEKTRECELVLATGVHEDNGFIRNNRSYKVYLWRKFVPEGNMDGVITDRSHTPINFPIIRYADVLLMLAEAENELGNQSKAVEYINMVRQRPSTNLPALNSGPQWLKANSKDEVFERIFQERAVELAGEGIRFSDIRRWRLAESLLNKRVEYELDGKVIMNRTFTERDYLWPIPATEIEKNSDLKQNPKW